MPNKRTDRVKYLEYRINKINTISILQVWQVYWRKHMHVHTYVQRYLFVRMYKCVIVQIFEQCGAMLPDHDNSSF